MKPESREIPRDFFFVEDAQGEETTLEGSATKLWAAGDRAVRQGRLFDAKELYEKSLRLDPDNPMVNNNLERVYQIFELLGEQGVDPTSLEVGWTLSIAEIESRTTTGATAELDKVLRFLPAAAKESLNGCRLSFFHDRERLFFWESVSPFSKAMSDREMTLDADLRRSDLLLQGAKVALAFQLWRDFAFRMSAYCISEARRNYHSGDYDSCVRFYEAFFLIAAQLDSVSYCPAVLKAIAKPSLLYYVRARTRTARTRYLNISDILRRKPFQRNCITSLARALCQWPYLVKLFLEADKTSSHYVNVAVRCLFETRRLVQTRTTVVQQLLRASGIEVELIGLELCASLANRILPYVNISSDELLNTLSVNSDRIPAEVSGQFQLEAKELMAVSYKILQSQAYKSPYQYVAAAWPTPLASTALLVQLTSDHVLRVSHQKDLIMGWVRLSTMLAFSYLRKEGASLPSAPSVFLNSNGAGKSVSDGAWCQLLVDAARVIVGLETASTSMLAFANALVTNGGDRTRLSEGLFEYVTFRNRVLAHGITSAASQYARYFDQHNTLVDKLVQNSNHMVSGTWLTALAVDLQEDSFVYDVLVLMGVAPTRRRLHSSLRLRTDSVHVVSSEEAVNLQPWVRYEACPVCGHDRLFVLDKIDLHAGRVEYQSLSCATTHKIKDSSKLTEVCSLFSGPQPYTSSGQAGTA